MLRSLLLIATLALLVIAASLSHPVKGAETLAPTPLLVQAVDDPIGSLIDKMTTSEALREAAVLRAKSSLALARSLRYATKKVTIWARQVAARSVEDMLRVQGMRPEDIGTTQQELDMLKSNKMFTPPPILKPGDLCYPYGRARCV